jgi:hypothetical protein
LDRVHAAGIEVPYRYDDKIPWEARSIIEDLLFQLDQKANKTAHLHRKIEGINQSSRLARGTTPLTRTNALASTENAAVRRDPPMGYHQWWRPGPSSYQLLDPFKRTSHSQRGRSVPS